MDPTVVDPLYGLPAADFVAARNALAKELRAAGDKAGAAEVAKLRRPTATAWALNQIARHQPTLIDEALDARSALLAVTEGTGRGEAGGDLRTATAEDRAATRAVLVAARDLLGGEDAGLSARITSTLLAAVLDPEVAATLVSGRLATEQDASAFSLGADPDQLAEVIVLADRAPKRKAKPDAAEREAAEAERERRRRRTDQERAVERLTAKVARLEAKVAEAEGVLAAAREEAEAAAAELEAAKAALDDL